MKPYELIEHTADIGIKVRGKTLTELFENAARGMFAIIAGEEVLRRIRTKEYRKVEIKKEIDTFEELLVEWLSELLYIFDRDGILFASFRILELSNKGITADAAGEKTNTFHNMLQTDIKAVTFHNLKIEKDKNGFNCTVIFDV